MSNRARVRAPCAQHTLTNLPPPALCRGLACLWGGSSWRPRSPPCGRLALPVLVAARPHAGAPVVCAQPAGSPGRLFCALRCASARSPPGAARASPSSGARARRRSGAAAPRLPAPPGAGVLALAPLRWAAGCAAACPSGRPARGRAPCPVALPLLRAPCWATAAPAGPPSRAGGCWGLGLSRRLPRRGLSRRQGAALGGRVPGPAGSGVGRAAARRPAARGAGRSRAPARGKQKKSARIWKVVQMIDLPSAPPSWYTEIARSSH